MKARFVWAFGRVRTTRFLVAWPILSILFALVSKEPDKSWLRTATVAFVAMFLIPILSALLSYKPTDPTTAAGSSRLTKETEPPET